MCDQRVTTWCHTVRINLTQLLITANNKLYITKRFLQHVRHDDQALALPSMFSKATQNIEKKFRGNQHNRKPESALSKTAVGKRLSGRLSTALKKAPQDIQTKWSELCALKGSRGMDIFAKKKEFMPRWVQDPTWDILPELIL